MPSQERINWAKIRIVVTTIASIAITAVFIYLKLGSGFFQPKDEAFTYVEDSGGMQPGAKVRFLGIQVGKIGSIDLAATGDPKKIIRVGLAVEERYLGLIPADSTTDLASDNLLGDKFVNITRGVSTQPLQRGGELLAKPPSILMKNADIQQLQARIKEFDVFFADIDAGKGDLGEFIKGEALYDQTRDRIKGLQQAIHASVGPQSDVGKLLYSTSEMDAARAPLKRLDDMLAQIQAGQGIGEYIYQAQMYDDLRKTVEGLRKSVREMRASTLMSSDEAYRGVLSQLRNMERQLDEIRVGPAFTSEEAFESINGPLRELAYTMKDFRLNPRKYLRIKIF